MSVKFHSCSRNWAGDAGGISTDHIMNKGKSIKEGECGTMEGYEAWWWIGKTSDSVKCFHELRIDTHYLSFGLVYQS